MCVTRVLTQSPFGVTLLPTSMKDMSPFHRDVNKEEPKVRDQVIYAKYTLNPEVSVTPKDIVKLLPYIVTDNIPLDYVT